MSSDLDGERAHLVYESVNLSVWRATRHHRGARILDVGCGTGALADRLTRLGNHVEGVTHNPDEAAIARDRMAAVHLVDLDEPEHLAELVDLPSFDAVILAGVLEHLKDPVRVLRALGPALDRGIPVYVSLPNIACWYIRLGLLAGRFQPRDDGILDRTHLHHYTLSTAREMLGEAGLTVDWMDVTPSFSVWFYSHFVKKVASEPDRPRADRADFAFYERWVFPVERVPTVLWKRMLANEIMFAARRGPTPVRRQTLLRRLSRRLSWRRRGR
ncbi:MAG: class I SAM-dependent methyltransferase [Acidimicrobiia bacterium]